MPDVVEQRGGTRRSGRALAVAAVLLVVASAALWVEGARREPGERARVEACAQRADDAVAMAEMRLSNRANYVRPVLGTAPESVEDGLLRLIAGDAPEGQLIVGEAMRVCREVDIWWLHDLLRDARDAQVALLEAEDQRLAAVATDGRAYFSGWEEVRELRAEAARLRP